MGLHSTVTADGAAARYVRLVVVACAIGALANLAGTLAVPSESDAIRSRGSGSIGVLLTTEHDHVANRYAMYGQLRDLAAGATITAPPALLDGYYLEQISTLDYEPSDRRNRVAERTLDGLAAAGATTVLRGAVETSFGAKELRNYVIAVSEKRSRLHAYETRRTGTVLIVDAATAETLGLP